MVRAVRGNLDHLAAQPSHQRSVFAHRVNHDDPILRDGEKHIQELTLCGKALAGARRAQIHPVCRFQLFAVSHNDIVRKCVHAIVEGLPSHAELPCHKRNKDGCGAGGHTALDFYLVVTKGQRGNKALFLLPVQTAQSAVVFLRDTAHGKHIVFQPLAVRSKVYHRKGQQKHSLIAGLQISQKFRCVLAECNQVRGKNIRVIAGAHSLSLFLHFHFSDVRDFPLDGLNCLELIHGLNVHGHGHFRIQLQDFRQQLIRKLRCHNLQVGHRAPILADTECAGLAEVETVRGNKVFCAKPGLWDVFPRKAERLAAPRMHLGMKQRKAGPPVHRLRGNAQPLKVSHDISLHTLQTGPSLRNPLGGYAKGDVF